MRVLQILLRTTLCAPFLSPSSQARVTLGIAVVDSTSVFISSLQWSQRISTIQLGICLLPNLNVVSWDDKTEPNLKNMSIFNDEKKLQMDKFQWRWVCVALLSPRPLPPFQPLPHSLSGPTSRLQLPQFLLWPVKSWFLVFNPVGPDVPIFKIQSFSNCRSFSSL